MISQPPVSFLKDFTDYCIDFPQRAILFSDILRKRGNNTEPEPGQTLAHVQQAEIRFLGEVARRHPDAEKAGGDRAQYQAAGKIIKHHAKFAGLTPGEIKRISRQQAAFLTKNQDLAIATLADLLVKAEDRNNALQIAMDVAEADDQALDEAERAMLAHIKAVLLP
jgi:hypothetical protein